MIQLGKFQDLYIVKKKEFGVYVNDQKDVTDGSILLPAKQVPDGARIGDQISCFVYKDSEDRPIATVHIPKITLGAIRPLRVKEVSKIGAFLDLSLIHIFFLKLSRSIPLYLQQELPALASFLSSFYQRKTLIIPPV